LFARASNGAPGLLFAQAFDDSKLRTTGDPVPVVESVDATLGNWAKHQFSVSRDGVLVYASDSQRTTLTWFDRSGKMLGTVGAAGTTMDRPSISPDGGTVALPGLQTGLAEIWLHDLARGTDSRLTFHSGTSGTARAQAWSPDGKFLAFGYAESDGTIAIVRKAVERAGAAEPLGSPWGNPARGALSLDWSRDGRYLVAALLPVGSTGIDIWMLALDARDAKSRPYLQTTASEGHPSLAPSGDWLAYASDETRRFEVYVQSFPVPGRKHQVSANGGTQPVWRRDGKELYFIAPDRQLMAVPVRNTGSNLEIGEPKALFDSIPESPG
jgi:eukaryotic-like serine/threonine-protein kinase